MPRGSLDLRFWSQVGAWTYFWGSFGPILPHSAPPGRCVNSFGVHFGGHFGSKSCPNVVLICDVFSRCFLEGSRRGFGVVLGDFVVPKRCTNGKGTMCGNGCFSYVISTFSEVVGSIWGAKKREQQSRSPIWIPSRLCGHFGTILGVIFGAQIVKTAMLEWSLSGGWSRGGSQASPGTTRAKQRREPRDPVVKCTGGGASLYNNCTR